MKKIIALCMAGIMLASVAGCSSETSKAAAPAGPDSSAARENELYSMVSLQRERNISTGATQV